MLANLSIKTRLLFLSSVLIVIIVASTYFLPSKLSDNSQHIPVVILTAKDLTAIERDLLQSRVRDVIAKGSVSAKDLASVVRQTLREHASTGEAVAEAGCKRRGQA